ncbi:MAG TPA: hypothetical protein VGB55_00940, partial [Tepidisphaeraceae bacterium]
MAAIVADDEQSPVPAVHAPLAAGDYAEVGMNLSGVHYYAAYWPFADALKMETRGWMNGPTSNYGSVPNASLDARGNPTITGSFHAQPFQNSGNPIRAPRGLYTVTWTGNGTVGLSNAGTPVSQSLDGPVKTRTYRLTSGHPIVTMTNNGPVTDANGVVTAGVGDVHVWMPDPTDPQNKSLVPVEGREQLFHPDYLKQIKSLGDKIGYLRFMDWGNTNSSPQVNWSDRRPADHQFAAGNTNWKLLNIPGSNDTARFGNIGVPWEYMIELCNTLDISPWITVPHAATDDYIKNLAELMAGKSSTSPGLESGLKVYLEHSNEIWSNGNSFTQGDWAKQQADARGITKAQFTARRAVDVFRSFHQTFASIPGADGTSIDRSNDIIRVAAAFTGQTTTYTTPYLAEMKAYAGRLESAGEPNYMADTLAITTYFGGQSLTRYAFNETDWKNANLNDVNDPVMNKVFDHWLNEFTLNAAGGGIEGDAGLGGFGTAMTGLAKQYGLTLTSYEGGPSIYTETVEVFVKDGKIVTSSTPGATSTFSLSNYAASINGGKDTFTTMLAAMNRHPRMAEIYKATLSIAKAQGLKTHGAYNDISGWGKYGQWGTMEYLGQPVGYDYGQAVKWQFLQDWSAEQLQIRDIDDVLGTAPTLPSSRTLEGVFVNNQYTQDLIGTPGDGTGEQVKTEIIAGKLPPGLTFEQVGDGIARISGVPTTPGKFRVLVRSLDADKDPAYAIYTINTQKSSGLTTTYNANHDTFVEPSLTSTGNGGNGGSDQMLVGTGRRQGVVKFDMRSGVIGKVDQAILRIYVRGYEDSATNPKVPTDGSIWIEELSDQYRTSTAQWTEFGINNSTALAGTTRIGAIRPLANDPTGYLDFDVTEYVNRNLADAADRIVSFAIRGTVNNGDNAFVGVKVATKEFANNAYGPRILLKQSPTTSAIPPVVNIEPIRPNPRKGSIDAVSIQFSQEVTGL